MKNKLSKAITESGCGEYVEYYKSNKGSHGLEKAFYPNDHYYFEHDDFGRITIGYRIFGVGRVGVFKTYYEDKNIEYKTIGIDYLETYKNFNWNGVYIQFNYEK